MRFEEAMKAIKAGKKVRRKSWGSAFRSSGIGDKDLDQYFMIVKPCADEFLSEDWYIVEEKPYRKIVVECTVEKPHYTEADIMKNRLFFDVPVEEKEEFYGRKIKVTVETVD